MIAGGIRKKEQLFSRENAGLQSTISFASGINAITAIINIII